MPLPDKTLTCSDCGQEFLFSGDDQEFYASRGFTEPKRCRNAYGKRHKLNLVFECTLAEGSVAALPKHPDPNQVGVEWVPLEMRSGSCSLHTGPSATRAASSTTQ